jgi:hypothetical protein
MQPGGQISIQPGAIESPVLWRRLTFGILVTSALGCEAVDRSLGDAPPQPVSIIQINASAEDPLGAIVLHPNSTNDSVRVQFSLADGSETGATPWQSPQLPVTVLGLEPGERYSLWIEGSRDRKTVDGAKVQYVVQTLPQALAGLHVSVSGAFSGGYSLAPLPGADGHGYLVSFDSVGTIRWYRDFGSNAVFASSQQPNGLFTAYVGGSNGFNKSAGVYVEITARGDSIRSYSAPAGSYTDPHELAQTIATSGHVTSYFFAYEFKQYDRTAFGGGPVDPVAVHQILAVDDAGKVDTVFDSADRWSIDESVELPHLPDLDHPNSIDLDAAGDLIVSYRDLNAIVKIDPTTKKVVWQLGGIRNQFAILGDPFGGFDGQHDVRVLPNGHLLMFDNGWTHSPAQSRAVEYALDTQQMTATMVWQYAPSPSIFNEYTGSAQRLANGNTLVAFTEEGIVDEVRPDGTLLARATIKLSSGRVGTPYRVTRINNFYNFAPP